MGDIWWDGLDQDIETTAKMCASGQDICKQPPNLSYMHGNGLSIVWAIKKFHMFLFARPFTLVTDCKVLLSIFSPVKGIPSTAASR